MFVLPEGDLHVNADVSDGWLVASIHDESCEPLPGFERSEPITSNTVDSRITWPGQSLSTLAGRKVYIRFTLFQGRLFSYWIE